MQHEHQFAARFLADVCVKRAFQGRKFGVFVENVPRIDLPTFVGAVGEYAPDKVRLALLGGTKGWSDGTRRVQLTSDPSVANQWRNDLEARGGRRTIFVVLGAAPKLNSLRTAVPQLTPKDLRQELFDRCLRLLDSPERRAFLTAVLSERGQIPLAAFIAFAAEIEHAGRRSTAALMDVEPKAVRYLGLLQSPSLHSAQGPVAARRAVRRNLDLIQNLRSLQPGLRTLLSELVERKHALAPRAASILRFADSGRLGDLGDMTLEEVSEALHAKAALKPQEKAGEEEKVRRVRVEGDVLALELAFDEEGRGLKAASQRFRTSIEPNAAGQIETDDIRVGRRTILPRVKVGTSQATALFGKLLDEKTWGGFVLAPEAPDFVSAHKLVQSDDVEIERFRPDDEHQVRGILKRAVDRGIASADALKAWDDYATVRAELLDHANPLIDHPLLTLAGDDRIAERARTLLQAYSRALQAVKQAARELDERGSSEAAKRLIACVLCVDLIFVQAKDGLTAVAAPTHPFHLWRWDALLSLFSQHRDELQSLGRELLEPLVTDPPSVCPQIVLSPFALTHRLDRPKALIAVGAFAALPLFGEPSSRRVGRFRARGIEAIAERFVRLMPHASLGLRVALVDPPSLAGAMEDLLEITNALANGVPTPVHIRVLRTEAGREETDEEEEAASSIARELTELGGTLDVIPPLSDLQAVAEELSASPVHVAVVFDPGVGERISVAIADRPTLSPLVVPRAYKYDAFDDRLDMVIAGDAEPFGTYHELYCKSLGVPLTDFVGRRSGASQSSRALEALARGCVWLVVVDQAVEPTIRISGTERLDWRSDGGRDVVTFTSHPDAIEDLIRDAVRVAGLVPDEETVKRTLRELFSLSGEAVLSLAKVRPDASLANPRLAKGMLGVLTANRWYTQQHPDALVISLDDPQSRQWILGAGSDDRHGDLLGVRAGQTGVILEALEVKAHEDPDAGVRYQGGSVEGHPINQIDQTISLLQEVFAALANSPVVAARREILRDQLYRAVASRPYDPDRRGRYVRLLEELFASGPAAISGAVFRVKIDPRGPSTADARNAKTPYGRSVAVVDLVETGASAVSTKAGPSERAVTGATASQGRTERKAVVDLQESGGSYEAAKSPGPEPEKRPSTSRSAPAGGNELRVLVGTSPSGDEVFWDPHRVDVPLNNFGFLVTGDSGSGKTQILKALIAVAAESQLPVCIFDFKNDYAESDDQFARRHGFQVYDIDRNGLPFNPLSLLPDERGESQPIRQVHELAGILSRIFKLGAQQEAKLKRAIIAAYEAHGVRPEARYTPSKVRSVPGFEEVKAILEHDGKNELLLNRLSPLFDLNLFPAEGTAKASFEELLAERVILDLHRLPDDRIKAAMSEFMIVRLHGYVLKGDQPRRLRRLLVLDEAWRVMDSARLQELAREGRAFGVGIVLGTQFPGDIPENLTGNLASQLLLANQDPEHRRVVVRTLCGTTSGPDATRLMQQLMHLRKHEGFFRNQQHAPYCLVESLPYFKRATPG
jgi:hypothetical protein